MKKMVIITAALVLMLTSCQVIKNKFFKKNAFSVSMQKLDPTGWDAVELKYTGPVPGKNLLVKISPQAGNNWFSLQSGTNQLLYSADNLSECPYYRDNRGTVVLFPTPHNVKDGKYKWNGSNYFLKGKNDKEQRSLHGILYDAAWNFKPPKTDEKSAVLETWYELTEENPLFQAYPFSNKIALRYILKQDRLRIEYEVLNTGSISMPYGFGLMPYFRIPGGNISNIKFECDIPQMLETSRHGISASGLSQVRGSRYHYFPAKTPDTEISKFYHRLLPESKVAVHFLPYKLEIWMIATGQFKFLGISKREKYPDFFSIAHTGCSPDAHNLYAAGHREISGLQILEPGQSDKGSIEYIIVYDQPENEQAQAGEKK
ncbi:MAG: hypothetical protein A2096_06445 [Spirochaetes bacterium GWF1_41_5]|nr:MAG: hypothetical protein A2096_06445 [Spirochaetes bacterium GWF1_41_5]HBE03731.1 hypothetical protein [Spirochaetia bacterium]